MKKIILIAITLVSLASCSSPGVSNLTTGNQDPLLIAVDTNTYRIVWVTVNSGGNGFYLMVPENANVTMPQNIGYKQGKVQTSVIKVD
jgi:hypothetical protein